MNVSSTPHVRSRLTTSGVMLAVIIGLLPATGFGIYNFGLRALIIIILAVLGCVGTEYIFGVWNKKQTINDLSAVVTGILLGLNLPVTVPFWLPIAGGFFGILIGKLCFGGLGQNFMNPALAGRCFLFISFPALMTNFTYDAYTTATPLAMLRNGETVNIWELVVGTTGGTIGETSAIAILVGGIFLIITGIIDLKIPAGYLISFFVCIAAFSGRGFDLPFLMAHLAGGGLLLGAFFMATDYVTRPVTPKGQVVFGILLGVLTAIFRIYGPSVEGVSFAIILGNLLVPIIEKYTLPKGLIGKKKEN